MWENFKQKLDEYGGIWEEDSYDGAITTVIPKTALLGNGDVGITSYGGQEQKTYLISKGNFWNAGDMKTSDPFRENDRTRRPLTIGGLTIKKSSEETVGVMPAVSVKAYREIQKLSDPELITELTIEDIPVEFTSWMSATKNIFITRVKSKGGKLLELQADVWIKEDGSENFAKDSGTRDGIVWVSRSTYNAAKDNPDSWTSKAVIASKIVGKTSSKMQFTLEPGESVWIVTAVCGGGKTYDYQDVLQTKEPLEEAEELLKQFTNEEDIQDLRKEHEAWWKNYWLKSYIDIGDEAVHRYYYGSLYYMGCTARKDTLAPGLYGVWFTTDEARYQGDYHMNYNYVAPFYGMYSANRYEGAYSLTQPILDYEKKAEWAAKHSLERIDEEYVSKRADLTEGIDDAVLYPVGLAPWGAYTEDTYFGQTVNALFAATVFMTYFQYTQDEAFLRERAYPFLKKTANFYTKWCEKEKLPDGTYQYSLWDGAHENWFGKNPGITLGLVKAVYEFLLENAKAANASETELSVWKEMQGHLAEIPVRVYTNGEFSKPVFALTEEGSILEPEQASVNLEFVHPGDLLSFDSNPELLEIGRNSVEAKVIANHAVWGNMNNAVKMYTHAIRLGYNPEEVLRQFKKYNVSVMEKNFTIQDFNHGIEKAGGIEFINSMLLQSTKGIVKVFPNWTGADAKFTRLREKGAFLVSSELIAGDVSYVEIVSEAGKEVRLVNPWGNLEAEVVDSKGDVTAYRVGTTVHTGEATIEFAVRKGEIYTVRKKYHVIEVTEGGVQKALTAAKEMSAAGNPVMISFPKGEYHFYPENAFERELYISNTVGVDPAYKHKKIGILLENMKNIIVEGNDSLFIFHGKMTTFAAIDCENVVFRNYTVDFCVPTVVDLTVEEIKDNSAVISVPKCYDYRIDGTLVEWMSDVSPYTGERYWVTRDAMEYSQTNDTVEKLTWREKNPLFTDVVSIKEIGDHLLEFTYEKISSKIKKGYCYQMRPTVRDHAGAFFWNCKGVSLKDIHLLYMHGFGMVGQFSENFSLDHLHFLTCTETGRRTAGYADFIQMSGCKGKIDIKNCVFSNPHDDPINIHGTFLQVAEKLSPNKLRVRYMHDQTAGFPNFYVGDEVEFLTKGEMITVKDFTARVTSADGPDGRGDSVGADIILTLDCAVPEEIGVDTHVVENITWTPEVYIHDNLFEQTPTRGILVTTRRKVLIENNVFDGMGMAGVFISSDASEWYESGAVKDVTIRKNFFKRGKAQAVFIEPTNTEFPEDGAVHGNIRIEENTFLTEDQIVLDAKSVSNLILRNNEISLQNPENLYRLTGCRNVLIEKNKIK